MFSVGFWLDPEFPRSLLLPSWYHKLFRVSHSTLEIVLQITINIDETGEMSFFALSSGSKPSSMDDFRSSSLALGAQGTWGYQIFGTPQICVLVDMCESDIDLQYWDLPEGFMFGCQSCVFTTHTSLSKFPNLPETITRGESWSAARIEWISLLDGRCLCLTVCGECRDEVRFVMFLHRGSLVLTSLAFVEQFTLREFNEEKALFFYDE